MKDYALAFKKNNYDYSLSEKSFITGSRKSIEFRKDLDVGTVYGITKEIKSVGAADVTAVCKSDIRVSFFKGKISRSFKAKTKRKFPWSKNKLHLTPSSIEGELTDESISFIQKSLENGWGYFHCSENSFFLGKSGRIENLQELEQIISLANSIIFMK